MRVMIVGASTNPDKYGNKAVRAYLNQKHTVLPVHPSAETIEGINAYPDVAAAPGPIDRASMYVPPEVGFDVVTKLAGRGDVAELWFNPGSDSDALIDHARSLGFQPVRACSIRMVGEDPTLL